MMCHHFFQVSNIFTIFASNSARSLLVLANLQVVLELELSQPRRAPQEGHGMDANACAAIGLEAGCARLKSP
jgi:hypothetical protein